MRKAGKSLLEPESDKFLHIDTLRFIASMGIVISHYALEIDIRQSEELVKTVYYLHTFVDVFFVISGIIISSFYAGYISGAGKYGSFIKKRIARLLPLHWATLAFYVALALMGATKASQPERYEMKCLPTNALMLHAFDLICHDQTFNAPSWSISAEMGVYLLFPLFILLDRRWRWSSTCLAAAFIGGGFAWDYFNPPSIWYLRTTNFGILRSIPGFLIGVAAYTNRELVRKIPGAGKLAPALFGLCGIGMLVHSLRGPLVIMAYAGTVCAYACDLQGRTGRLVRRLAPFGVLTYSLYMLHSPVGVVYTKVIGERLLHLHGMALNAMIVTAVPVLIVVSWLSYVYFETPARLWLAELKLGGKKDPQPL